MMYRRKPEPVEAFQLTRSMDEEASRPIDDDNTILPEWFQKELDRCESGYGSFSRDMQGVLQMDIVAGFMKFPIGNFIFTDSRGRMCSMTPEAFNEIYEEDE